MNNKGDGGRVLVAMSGGLDSSAVCMMLLDRGYQVEGVTMRMWDTPAKFKLYNQELPDYIVEAQELAQRLGFPHHILDVREEFKQTVVKHFCDEYTSGRTPNPCVFCNKQIKWNYLLKLADERNCPHVATGHYAKIEQQGGNFYIVQGEDDTKDQSYFLWRLRNEELSRTLFPLGNMTKADVRCYLREKGFKEKAEKPESMEICFVEGDYRDFLRQQLPDIDQTIGKGSYVDNEGKTIGEHEGYPFYTIGQRKGLGIALGYPAFVTKINPLKNTIKLGTKEELVTTLMWVDEPSIPNAGELTEDALTVRIRYRSQPIACKASLQENGRVVVEFPEEVSAVTPGQSAVFYIGKRVIGGGIISLKKKSSVNP